jgi:2-polyprenyl-6-methoxyphenol hydroxylase-like FAD-dependent oxidoreductase
MGWEADRMVGQIDDAGDFYFDSASQVVLPAWSQGRIALVGDAAYCASPLSGHGTTIAMVGAYVLAGELARADGDHAAAFRSYEARLRPWIEEIQRFGRGAGARMTTPRTELGILFRRAVLRGQELLPKVNFAMSGAIQMSDRFVLPEYPLLQGDPR